MEGDNSESLDPRQGTMGNWGNTRARERGSQLVIQQQELSSETIHLQVTLRLHLWDGDGG